MNIGITIHLSEEKESLFINGIKQNAIFLVKVLRKIGYNAYLLNNSEVKAPYENKVLWNIEETPVYDYIDKFKETDLMFWLGATFTDQDIINFKKTGPNKKVIKYVCGNNYNNDIISSLFGSQTLAANLQEYDELWYVPQQEESNREYFRILHNLPANKVRPVPFIWDPMFIDATCQLYNNSEIIEKGLPVPVYRPGKQNKDKQLICFEPNIDHMKWHLPNLLIAEDYLKVAGEFNRLNVIGGQNIIKSKYYTSIIKNTKMFNDDPIKLTYQPRLEIAHALALFGDVVLAHQVSNPLNYSYLDALYLQFPLVHNAPMIKDAGYYYYGNNFGSGARQLKLAIEQHDNDLESYNENSERVLTRYTVYNEGLLETYKGLIETTMGIKDHKLGSMYDWQTNLYR